MPRRSERIKSREPVKEMGKQIGDSVDFDSSGSSHSSVNEHQVQEEPWVPPPSYRKHLTPNALMNSCRRASKRLARSLNEAVATCSESKLDKMMETSTPRLVVKSRAEPSTTDFFPLHDHVIGNVVALEPQGPINSTTTFLNQLARLNTSNLTPAKGDENIEKIADSNLLRSLAADMPENEEVVEAEKSMSKCLTQIEGPDIATSAPLQLNNFEQADCTPHASDISIGKQVYLTENIAASNIIGDQSYQCKSKSNSMVGHPSQSYSFTLTELANGMFYDEDSYFDEVDSSQDIVQGYLVKKEFVPTLCKIFDKYGDIFGKFPITRKNIRSHVLEDVCKIVKKLEDSKFSQIPEAELRDMVDCVTDLGNANMELSWLHQKLEEILDAKQLIKQSRMLREKRDSNRQNIAEAERECEALEAEKRALDELIRASKDKLAREREESDMIKKTITDALFKVQRCCTRPLVDGLF